jgi:uncharacterized repeat protein (TIGR02543 family)
MKTRTVKLYVLAVGLIAAVFFLAACSNPSGSDGDYYGPPWTVEFNTNGGSLINGQQVQHGTRATMPTHQPTKTGFVFDDWYADSNLAEVYDFSTPVSGSIIIYAGWGVVPTTEGLYTNKSLHAQGSQPVDLTGAWWGADILEKTINYVNAYPEGGPYTLVLGSSVTGSGYALNAPNTRLTIVGTSASPTITLDDTSAPLFTVGATLKNGIRLTLDNVKILGNGSSTTNVIIVTDGAELLLRGNAEITGHTTSDKHGAVKINGSSITSFMMNGGKIYENMTTSSDGAGGVYVDNIGVFTMSGGEISGNLKNTTDAGDVYVHYNSVFTLAPEAPYIAVLTLGAGSADTLGYFPYAKIIIDNALSAPTAGKNVTQIDLCNENVALADIKEYCKGIEILRGSSNYRLVSGDFDKFGLGSFIGSDGDDDIGPEYIIYTDSTFFGKLLPVSNDSGPVAIGSIGFSSLAEAVNAAPSTGTSVENPTIITVKQDMNVDARIIISNHRHIKLVADSQKTITLTSTAGTSVADPDAGVLFSIVSVSSLTLGNHIKLTADVLKATALVSVPNTTRWPNAKFVMEEGSEISGFQTSSQYGAVKVTGGTFMMKGGTITNNTSSATGSSAAAGVYIGQNDFNANSPSNPGGVFDMTGGSITGNSLSGNDNAAAMAGVFVEGTGIRAGKFTNEGGSITGNTRTPLTGDTTPVASNYTGE